MNTINPFTDPMSGIFLALSMAFSMFWEILWALILGFTLSGIVQAVISKGEMSRLLPDASPKSIAVACGLGAASSSCSYASVALARSIFRKGGNFTAAIAFQFASTNLVIELGIILAVLMGWQFTLAEYVGGLLMIVILVFFFKVFLKPQMVKSAKQQANRGLSGKMEGHANMDMSVTEGSIWQRIFSDKGFTAISHYFVMDWVSVWLDIALGLVIGGALAAWIPNDFWQAFFLTDHPIWSKLWGPIVGPIVAIFTFVCSVGNVPLAAVLWNGGISFGGVVAFIFADLIILPILNIYRKYYGLKVSIFLAIAFYTAMGSAALIVEIIFQVLGLIPQEHKAKVVEASIKFNYTTVLNILFLVLAVLLVIRFFKTGGTSMLQMMNSGSEQEHSEPHNMMHYAVAKRRKNL